MRDRYQRELLGTASEMGSFWEKVLEEDVYANLMAAIEQLPPQCRLVMQLTLEGLKISEIASRLRISEDTVKGIKKRQAKTCPYGWKSFPWYFDFSMIWVVVSPAFLLVWKQARL